MALARGPWRLAAEVVRPALFEQRQRPRRSWAALRCGRCAHKVDANEGVRLFMRRHMPEASVSATQSLTEWAKGSKKQVGIYAIRSTSPPCKHVAQVLNSGAIACPRCGAVDWRAVT